MKQAGHALSTTLIIMILFSIFAMNIAKNSLIDFKIAHAFGEQQLHEERHLSALRYLENIVLPALNNPQSHLFEAFSNIHDEDSLQVDIPIANILNRDELHEHQSDVESSDYLNPQANIAPIPSPTHDISNSAEIQKLRAVILDPNTGQKLIATYQYNAMDRSDTNVVESLRRLSFRKISLRSDANT